MLNEKKVEIFYFILRFRIRKIEKGDKIKEIVRLIVRLNFEEDGFEKIFVL